MKKHLTKSFSFLLLLFIFITIFSVSANAYLPEDQFECEVDKNNIPQSAKYIDILFPISESDECYVEFNKENGEKFGISADSEIAKYNADGYRSYTFHVVDAYSKMVPSYYVDFEITNEIYDKNKELISQIKSLSCHTNEFENPVRYYFSGTVEIYSQDIEKIIELLKRCNINPDNAVYDPDVFYNSPYIIGDDSSIIYLRDSKYDYTYFCDKYGYAKLAYLDSQGNVISVTNEVDIDIFSLSDVRLNLSVSGNKFSSDPENGPPYWLIGVFYIILPAILISAILVVIICIYIKKRKNRKMKSGHNTGDGSLC